jgi:hypothetical protein
MQTKFIKISAIAAALSFLLVGLVFAQGDRSPLDSSYLFHLYYDNDQLFADRDFQFKYDVIPETFVPETLSTQFPYKGEVIDFKGNISKIFRFDPRQDNPKFLKGKISVKAPYISDGQKVIFYNSQNKPLLTIFVQESSFCNDDGVCSSDVGEDNTTCPFDCKTATPSLGTSTGSSAGPGGVLKGIIYLIIGLAIAGGFWYWLKKRNQPAVPMPSMPPDIRV